MLGNMPDKGLQNIMAILLNNEVDKRVGTTLGNRLDNKIPDN